MAEDAGEVAELAEAGFELRVTTQCDDRWLEQKFFRGDAVRIDGKKFLRCALFEDCVLYYGGERCEWENSRFLDAASWSTEKRTTLFKC